MTLPDSATWAWVSGQLDSLPSYLLARCLHLRHKVLPRWVWEKVPDPANSNSGQPHMEVSKKGGLPGPSGRVAGAGRVGSGREQSGEDEGGQYLSLVSSQEMPQAQPLGDFPILKVEEMEPLPVAEPPQASTRLDSGYEKHFLPTPEELGLLGPPPGPTFWPEPTTSQEAAAHVTDEDTEDQGG